MSAICVTQPHDQLENKMNDLPLTHPQHIVPDPSPTSPPKTGKQSIRAETGGPTGPEPTRYGDWEKKGRCYDF